MSYVKLSWQEAREACQRESNGNLMSVHSVFEQGKSWQIKAKCYVASPLIINGHSFIEFKTDQL